jgi:hypothetical protein
MIFIPMTKHQIMSLQIILIISYKYIYVIECVVKNYSTESRYKKYWSNPSSKPQASAAKEIHLIFHLIYIIFETLQTHPTPGADGPAAESGRLVPEKPA